MTSAIYLTARNGYLLKYRVSIYAADSLDIVDVAESFIEENLRSVDISPSLNGMKIETKSKI